MGIFFNRPKEIVKLDESLAQGIRSDLVDQSKLINYVRERSTTRKDKINLYAEMIRDGVIDSALEMISDDANSTVR